jgi:hypothetical protein
MTVQVTNPLGSMLTSISPPAWCTTTPTPTPAAPLAFVSIICPVDSPGILNGTTIAETIQLPTPVPTPVGGTFASQSVVYNANGPSPQGVIAAQEGTCNPIAANGSGTCTATLPSALQPGEEGVFQVTGVIPPAPPPSVFPPPATLATGQTFLVPTSGAPASLGNCPLSTTLPTSVSFPSGPLTITYDCGDGESAGAPASATITLINENGVSGQPSIYALVDAAVPVPIPNPITAEIIFSVAGLVPTQTGTATATATATSAPGTFCSALAAPRTQTASTRPTPSRQRHQRLCLRLLR